MHEPFRATMNPLLTILRAAHCRSTHHHFAIDALPLVETPAGDRLVKILLRHHQRYLTGAKDPDTRFRDFQNHVVHVTDGYWGGAPRVAHQWYDRMQRYLRAERWGDAAHAAGVLSHYFTDPMMPLHTQQCTLEKVLHRPIEWSVTKSYRSIMKLWNDSEMRIVFDFTDEPGWLGEAILHGARHANQFYFPLMDTYDLGRGRRKPQQGLSLIANQALAELFGLAITGWARVIDRAATEAEVHGQKPLPSPSTSLGMVLATTRVPLGLWMRKIEHGRERKAVEALIQEFDETGALKKNLPAEVDIVHRVVRVYADEKVWKKRREQLKSDQTEITVLPFPVGGTASKRAQSQRDLSHARLAQEAVPFRLTLDAPLVDAPSIGPRTADRFTAIGIQSVKQFLDATPKEMSESLCTRWINPSILKLWQWQATVMCEVPGLSALAAQLLAGGGYQTRESVAACDPADLHETLAQYAMTSAGRRYLRGQTPPELSEVIEWIQNAGHSAPLNRQPTRQAA